MVCVRIAVLLTLLGLSAPAQQPTWNLLTPGGPDDAMIYDRARRNWVRFDGSATWTGNPSSSWTLVNPADSPPTRTGHRLVWHPATQTAILFGGSGSASLRNDMWAWDGTNWTQWNPAIRPSARYGFGFVLQESSGDLFLFGGMGPAGPLNDTWIYRNGGWFQQVSPSTPSARYQFFLAWDFTRQETILFSGIGSGELLTDTWVWKAGTWIRKYPAVSPPARYAAVGGSPGPAFPVMLFGGTATTILADTWTWNGAIWIQWNGSPPAGPRMDAGLSFDSDNQRLVLYGGNGPDGVRRPDAWIWNGTGWSRWTQNSLVSPRAREGAAMAWFPPSGRVVLFGGVTEAGISADTHEFGVIRGPSRHEWRTHTGSGPSARTAASLTYDSSRHLLILFGGLRNGVSLNDTWAWDGDKWSQIQTPSSPPARNSHAAAYDSLRRELVLFGGSSANANLADTWVFNGTSWLQRSPGTSPAARFGHGMAYDTRGNRTVLFGGRSSSYLSDLWEWNGAMWEQIPFTGGPTARSSHSMLYDPARGSTLFFGGMRLSGLAADIWRWKGNQWEQVAATTPMPARAGAGIAYSAVFEEFILFGGRGELGPLGDTWSYAPGIPNGHVPVTLDSFPQGVTVLVDGAPMTLPQTFYSLSGSVHQIAALPVPPQWDQLRLGCNNLPVTFTVSGSGAAQFFACTPLYALNASASPPIGGSIQVSPAAPDNFYARNTPVTMTALPAPGYRLRAWSGDAAGSALSVSTQIINNRSVTAHFEPISGPGKLTPQMLFRESSGSVRLVIHGSSETYVTPPGMQGIPAAAVTAEGNTVVIMRDPWGTPHHSYFNAALRTWTPWRTIGGNTAGTPALAISAGKAWTAIRDSYGGYWLHGSNPATGEGSWRSLGGLLMTDPALAVAPDSALFVAGRDAYGAVWAGRFVPQDGSFTWSFGGGVFKGNISLIVGHDNIATIAGRDNWDALYLARFNGTNWVSWHFGSGIIATDPIIVVTTDGQLHTSALDAYKAAWFRPFQPSTASFSSWYSIGGILADAAPAVSPDGLHLAAHDIWGGLYWNSAATGWQKVPGISTTSRITTARQP